MLMRQHTPLYASFRGRHEGAYAVMGLPQLGKQQESGRADLHWVGPNLGPNLQTQWSELKLPH